MTSAKKLGGDKPRYLIMYKLEGKEHQITLGEDGVRTKKAKKKVKKKAPSNSEIFRLIPFGSGAGV